MQITYVHYKLVVIKAHQVIEAVLEIIYEQSIMKMIFILFLIVLIQFTNSTYFKDFRTPINANLISKNTDCNWNFTTIKVLTYNDPPWQIINKKILQANKDKNKKLVQSITKFRTQLPYVYVVT